MSLENELRFRQPVNLLGHKALLSTYYTASVLRRRAGEFFRPFGLTDVQFNVMMLLAYQSGDEGGLSQAEIGEMMLVNPANITTLVDRMERAGLVTRRTAANDRRRNIIALTPRGRTLLGEVEPLYAQEVERIMAALKASEQQCLVAMLEKVRGNISEYEPAGTAAG
ncbi:MAG TPA: MarR family transcriptional regulator [Phycisphaerales bacterium]|nr:MarR family transcriptional regulator [Phycisphaerales bacterium]